MERPNSGPNTIDAMANDFTLIHTNTTQVGATVHTDTCKRDNLTNELPNRITRMRMACTCTNDYGAVVICGVLCFVQNKIPLDTLGRRDLTLKKSKGRSHLFSRRRRNTQSLVMCMRKKARKNTGTKQKSEADVDDILQLLVEADRAKVDLPRFAAVDINKFPHVPLEEADGGVIMQMMASSLENEIEGATKSIKESLTLEIDNVGIDCGAVLGEMTSTLKNDLQNVMKGISEELSVIQQKVCEMTDAVADVSKPGDEKAVDERSYSEVIKASAIRHSLKQSEKVGGAPDAIARSDLRSSAGETSIHQNDKSSVSDNRDGKWILVDHLKRRNIKALVGSNKEQSCLEGAERKQRDTWDLYVGNLKENVTVEQVACGVHESQGCGYKNVLFTVF